MGEQGPQGSQGIHGLAGLKGMPGDDGLSGDDGSTGLDGPRGITGNPGEIGETGGAGDVGSGGQQGQKGEKGVLGEPGPQGHPGLKGQQGDFVPAGARGDEGAQGSDGARGLAGQAGDQGQEGGTGPDGVLGSKGDRGRQGLEGLRGDAGVAGPPGPPATLGALLRTSGYGGIGQLAETPRDPPVTAEKAGTVHLYRSQQTDEEVEEEQEIDPLSTVVTLVRDRLTLYRQPNGTKNFPARTCKDLYMSYPDLPSGFYWIDPNDGIPDDAIRVHCDHFTHSSCLYPQNKTEPFRTEKKKWYTGEDGYKWLGEDLNILKNIEYVAETSQLEFLRLLSDRAKQRIKYNCKDSVAWSDEKNEFSKSIKIKANNGVEMHAESSNKFKPKLILDDCSVKDGKWHHTVLEVDSPKPYRLPILDIAAYDIGDSGEEFGIEIERLCFS
ncbi:collagen alpha-2(I) chain-like [Oculina patagonica]